MKKESSNSASKRMKYGGEGDCVGGAEKVGVFSMEVCVNC